MVYKVTDTASQEDRHSQDIECAAYGNGILYTGDDDGTIKAWDDRLKLLHSWKAHEYVVNDLAVDDEGCLYSCSLEGEIKKWSMSGGSPSCLTAAVQTGPSGQGADYGSLGLAEGGLQDTPVTVKTLLWRGSHLYSGDLAGSACRWSRDLEMEMKKEYYTEVWSLDVTQDETEMYTARDNEVIVADIGARDSLKYGKLDRYANTVQVNTTFAGRAPVLVAGHSQDTVVCVDRAGMNICVMNRKEKSRFEAVNLLKGHDMIINSLVLSEKGQLFSGGWDRHVNIWSLNEQSAKYSVPVDFYINVLCLNDRTECFAAGQSGNLVKIAQQV